MNSDVSRKYVSIEIAEEKGKARRGRESDEARGDKGRENTPETVRRREGETNRAEECDVTRNRRKGGKPTWMKTGYSARA